MYSWRKGVPIFVDLNVSEVEHIHQSSADDYAQGDVNNHLYN